MTEVGSEENSQPDCSENLGWGEWNSYLLKYMFMATPTTPSLPSPQLPISEDSFGYVNYWRTVINLPLYLIITFLIFIYFKAHLSL